MSLEWLLFMKISTDFSVLIKVGVMDAMHNVFFYEYRKKVKGRYKKEKTYTTHEI